MARVKASPLCSICKVALVRWTHSGHYPLGGTYWVHPPRDAGADKSEAEAK